MTDITQERLTPKAHERLEQYLRQVRSALSDCPSVSADDMERDIREHIDNELSLVEGAVSLRQLGAIGRILVYTGIVLGIIWGAGLTLGRWLS